MLSNQMLSGIPEVDLGIEWVSLTEDCTQTCFASFEYMSFLNINILFDKCYDED
jgi:hypothetical protein